MDLPQARTGMESQRDSDKWFKLRSCVWEITLACCFNCKYCGSKAGESRENELTTEECYSVADQLVDLGCKRVSLIGGEVFMRPDWSAITSYLTRRNVRVSIITNGYLFEEDILEEIKNAGVESVAVSLDGPEAVHDAYRQKGSYQRAINAILALSEHGIPVSVISTLNATNIDHLAVLYQTLREIPVVAWQLQACSPMGNARELGIDYRFDFSKAIEFVGNEAPKAPFCMGIADNIGYFTEKEGWLRGNLSGYGIFTGCSAGIKSIGIDSIGNVRGCESMYDESFIEGNLREKKLRDIWENPDAFAYNRKFTPASLTGKCKTCKYGELCAGGCRSYNFFAHKKMYESPFCARNAVFKKL